MPAKAFNFSYDSTIMETIEIPDLKRVVNQVRLDTKFLLININYRQKIRRLICDQLQKSTTGSIQEKATMWHQC